MTYVIKSKYDRVVKSNRKAKLREKYVDRCCGCSWPGVGVGRWWKRKLSKARRRYIKMTLKGFKAKEPTRYESEVNWKTW